MAAAELPTHAARIAAATRIDRDGRSRYHGGGGHKGRRPEAEADAIDVRLVIAELEVALEHYADASQVTADDDLETRRAGKRARRRALDRVELAARWLDDVVLRRRGTLT